MINGHDSQQKTASTKEWIRCQHCCNGWGRGDEYDEIISHEILAKKQFGINHAMTIRLIDDLSELEEIKNHPLGDVWEYQENGIIDLLLNREEAHNQMFRDAFNQVRNSGSNQDFGTTKAGRIYFPMSGPGLNALAGNPVNPPKFSN